MIFLKSFNLVAPSTGCSSCPSERLLASRATASELREKALAPKDDGHVVFRSPKAVSRDASTLSAAGAWAGREEGKRSRVVET